MTFQLKTKQDSFQFQISWSFVCNFALIFNSDTLILKTTEDGSLTFYSDVYGQTYHSVHGAETESMRVFIELGLDFISEQKTDIFILEMGFGTGLNAYLSYLRAEEKDLRVYYEGLEAFPIEEAGYLQLSEEIRFLHEFSWEKEYRVSENFSFLKRKAQLETFKSDDRYDVIYFDAFSPDAQPELWTEKVFKKTYGLLKPDGVLVTYCSKSLVQRNMKKAGFIVEKHSGPPHKREVIRAIRN